MSNDRSLNSQTINGRSSSCGFYLVMSVCQVTKHTILKHHKPDVHFFFQTLQIFDKDLNSFNSY